MLSLYQHCFVYVHGHEFSGTNPALLKAMGMRCTILALNTGFNQEMLNNEPFTIFGDGGQKRAFSYIDDCLSNLWEAAINVKASKEIINLGGIIETSILEAAEILQAIVGGSEIQFLESRQEVKYAYPTYQKSIDILNYQEKTNLKDGLEKMWEWAKLQPVRSRFQWKEYELDQGIYQYWK